MQPHGPDTIQSAHEIWIFYHIGRCQFAEALDAQVAADSDFHRPTLRTLSRAYQTDPARHVDLERLHLSGTVPSLDHRPREDEDPRHLQLRWLRRVLAGVRGQNVQ